MSKHLGPAMPLYLDDFLGGTISFGASEVGAYFLLLTYQWANGIIENDAPAIERIAREEYGKLGRVLRKFDVLPDGSLRNQRCHEIREERIAYIERQREKAHKRWTGDQPAKDDAVANATAYAPASPRHMPQPCLPSPSPSPLPTPEELVLAAPSSSPSDDGRLAGGFDAFWKAYPRKVGKQAALRAWKRIKGKPPVATIIASIEAQKAGIDWQKDGGAYIPHPTTWLNRGGWDDEAVNEAQQYKTRLGR